MHFGPSGAAGFAGIAAEGSYTLFIFEEMVVAQAVTKKLPYKVKDLSLADWGRREIMLAEPDLLAGQRPHDAGDGLQQ